MSGRLGGVEDIRDIVARAIVEASGLSPLWGADVALKSADAAIAAYVKAVGGNGTLRCNICGFVVDTRFEATKPTIQFKMAGRTALATQRAK